MVVVPVNGASSERRVVPALARGLALLEALGAAQAPQTGADLARTSGLPRSTVHDLLRSLETLGYVREVDPLLHAFALGPAVLHLGSSYLSALDFGAEATASARRLSAASGETAQVAVLEGTDVVYVAKADSRNQLRLVSAVGRRLPAHLTGVGKALLAHLPAAELDRLYAGTPRLETMTEHSVGTLGALKKALALVRRAGVAYDYCESNVDVACVAAPITDHEGRVVAAMSASFPVTRWSAGYRDALGEQVLEATAQLSRTLGAP